MKQFLHVGCGPQYQDSTSAVFRKDDWKEVRLDIDEAVKPDIIGSMQNMHMINDGEFDGLYSSHNIEHLYPHEIEDTLREFHRVLTPEAELLIICPDLMVIAKEIVEGRFIKALYESPAGPIAPIDMLFGHRSSIQAGNVHMAHRCAFTKELIAGLLRNCGFLSVISVSGNNNVYALALKPDNQNDLATKKLNAHLGDS